MSSHQGSHYYPGSGPVYHESGLDSPVAQQPRRSWPPTSTADDQSGYSQPHQSLDPVGNSLEAYDAQDMNNSFNFPDPAYPLPEVLSRNSGVEIDATYTNDNIPSQSMDSFSFYSYPGLGHEFSQPQHGYTPYDSTHASVSPALQHPVQDIQTLQASQVPFMPDYSYSSQALLQTSHGGPVYRTDAGLTFPAPDNLSLEVANTAVTDADAGVHSHQPPVATSSANQGSVLDPIRPLPSSPEKKRLSAADIGELSATRRVLPRHDGAGSVHSMPSGSPMRSRSNSAVQGRGPLIPQERYTTSTISSYNAPDQHPVISFNLENPTQLGIPVIDILNKTDSYPRIRDRTEAFDMEKKTFTLRVQWPGYPSWSKTIAAMNWKKTRGPITRVKLAEAVATAIRDLFERYHDKQCDQDCARWSLGPNGIQLDQVCLVALHHVSKGSWQPELCLLAPRA